MLSNSMMVIDPHVHMTSRTTYDYLVMKEYGVVAVIEPAFWLGQPRSNVGTFQDYFNSLIGWEWFRAGQLLQKPDFGRGVTLHFGGFEKSAQRAG